ncbi:putative Macrophage mannose receptor 1 [Blattamonas nauphoetae]|uniref:Macrophage mannose receptor 1 n=1 Tax=Blattamonas nauphoetae TaxID=2049346 RepID=A0ABQ9XY98_9EUKA|nr:putative Macrophage mannose receptor 1 [Blattamonas nauphoetae]
MNERSPRTPIESTSTSKNVIELPHSNPFNADSTFNSIESPNPQPYGGSAICNLDPNPNQQTIDNIDTIVIYRRVFTSPEASSEIKVSFTLKQIAKQTSQKDSFKSKDSSPREQIDKIKNQKASLEVKASFPLEQITELKSYIASLEIIASFTLEQIDKLDGQIASFKSKDSSPREQIDEIKNQKASLKIKASFILEEIDILESQKAILEINASFSLEQITRLKSNNASLESNDSNPLTQLDEITSLKDYLEAKDYFSLEKDDEITRLKDYLEAKDYLPQAQFNEFTSQKDNLEAKDCSPHPQFNEITNPIDNLEAKDYSSHPQFDEYTSQKDNLEVNDSFSLKEIDESTSQKANLEVNDCFSLEEIDELTSCISTEQSTRLLKQFQDLLHTSADLCSLEIEENKYRKIHFSNNNHNSTVPQTTNPPPDEGSHTTNCDKTNGVECMSPIEHKDNLEYNLANPNSEDKNETSSSSNKFVKLSNPDLDNSEELIQRTFSDIEQYFVAILSIFTSYYKITLAESVYLFHFEVGPRYYHKQCDPNFGRFIVSKPNLQPRRKIQAKQPRSEILDRASLSQRTGTENIYDYIISELLPFEHLTRVQQYFSEHGQPELTLTMDQFVDCFQTMIESLSSDQCDALRLIFKKIDADKSGKVHWLDFSQYFMQQAKLPEMGDSNTDPLYRPLGTILDNDFTAQRLFHKGDITATVFSQNSGSFFTASYDGTLKQWPSPNDNKPIPTRSLDHTQLTNSFMYVQRRDVLSDVKMMENEMVDTIFGDKDDKSKTMKDNSQTLALANLSRIDNNPDAPKIASQQIDFALSMKARTLAYKQYKDLPTKQSDTTHHFFPAGNTAVQTTLKSFVNGDDLPDPSKGWGGALSERHRLNQIISKRREMNSSLEKEPRLTRGRLTPLKSSDSLTPSHHPAHSPRTISTLAQSDVAGDSLHVHPSGAMTDRQSHTLNTPRNNQSLIETGFMTNRSHHSKHQLQFSPSQSHLTVAERREAEWKMKEMNARELSKYDKIFIPDLEDEFEPTTNSHSLTASHRFAQNRRQRNQNFIPSPSHQVQVVKKQAPILIVAVCILPTSGYIVVCGADRRLTFYDPSSLNPKGQLKGFGSLPLSMCGIRDDETRVRRELLVLGKEDGCLDVFVVTPELMKSQLDIETEKGKDELMHILGMKSEIRRDLAQKNKEVGLVRMYEEKEPEPAPTPLAPSTGTSPLNQSPSTSLLNQKEDDKDSTTPGLDSTPELGGTQRLKEEDRMEQVLPVSHIFWKVVDQKKHKKKEEEERKDDQVSAALQQLGLDRALDDDADDLDDDVMEAIGGLEEDPEGFDSTRNTFTNTDENPNRSRRIKPPTPIPLEKKLLSMASGTSIMNKNEIGTVSPLTLVRQKQQHSSASNRRQIRAKTPLALPSDSDSPQEPSSPLLVNSSPSPTRSTSAGHKSRPGTSPQRSGRSRAQSRQPSPQPKDESNYDYPRLSDLNLSGKNANRIIHETLKSIIDPRPPAHSPSLPPSVSLRDGSFSVQAHTNSITKVEYVSELRALITSSLDCSLKLIDTESLTDKHIFSAHTQGVQCFAYSTKLKLMASGGQDRKVCLWNPLAKRLVGILEGHRAPVVSVAIDDSAGYVLSLSLDDTIRIVDSQSQRCLQVVPAIDTINGHRFLSVQYFPQLQSVILSSRRIVGWKHSARNEQNIVAHNTDVEILLFNRHFEQLVSIDLHNVVNLWNIRTGRNMFRFVAEHEDSITAATIDRSGRRLMTGSIDGEVREWNLHTAKLMKIYRTDGSVFEPGKVKTAKDKEEDKKKTKKEDPPPQKLTISNKTDYEDHSTSGEEHFKKFQNTLKCAGWMKEEEKKRKLKSEGEINIEGSFQRMGREGVKTPTTASIHHITSCSTPSSARTLVLIGSNKLICAIDDTPSAPPNRRILHTKTGTRHGDNILSASFHPPQTLLASSDDGALVAWNLETATERISLILSKERADEVRRAAKLMGDEDERGDLKRMIATEDIVTTQVLPIPSHPDLALTHSTDSLLRVWSISHAKLLLTVNTYQSSAFCAIDDSCSFLALGATDGSVQMYHVNSLLQPALKYLESSKKDRKDDDERKSVNGEKEEAGPPSLDSADVMLSHWRASIDEINTLCFLLIDNLPTTIPNSSNPFVVTMKKTKVQKKVSFGDTLVSIVGTQDEKQTAKTKHYSVFLSVAVSHFILLFNLDGCLIGTYGSSLHPYQPPLYSLLSADPVGMVENQIPLPFRREEGKKKKERKRIVGAANRKQMGNTLMPNTPGVPLSSPKSPAEFFKDDSDEDEEDNSSPNKSTQGGLRRQNTLPRSKRDVDSREDEERKDDKSGTTRQVSTLQYGASLPGTSVPSSRREKNEGFKQSVPSTRLQSSLDPSRAVEKSPSERKYASELMRQRRVQYKTLNLTSFQPHRPSEPNADESLLAILTARADTRDEKKRKEDKKEEDAKKEEEKEKEESTNGDQPKVAPKPVNQPFVLDPTRDTSIQLAELQNASRNSINKMHNQGTLLGTLPPKIHPKNASARPSMNSPMQFARVHTHT